jgi:hypothetical protein
MKHLETIVHYIDEERMKEKKRKEKEKEKECGHKQKSRDGEIIMNFSGEEEI